MSDLRLANFSSCCRLCLSESLDNIKSIFEFGTDDRELQQKISTSLGVEILAADKFSTKVCDPCIEKINNWHSYKQSCDENQSKLTQWMNNMPEIMTVSVKQEPVENVILSPDIIINGEVIKTESIEEEFNDFPPVLTSQAEQAGDEVEVQSPKAVEDEQLNLRRCSVCSKLLSSVRNRKKHERLMHGITVRGSTKTASDIGSLSQDDQSQSSIDSQPPVEEPTSEEKKILSVAGLKMLTQNSSASISREKLSKIELSYTEKCKAMVEMHNTLKCACHSLAYPNLKGLLSHLRSLKTWFPASTCYHCMITFTDNSFNKRHHLRCPKTNLETLVKLSNLKKRSGVKTRLYQNYKCTVCKFMFYFHEDFCNHVDEEHSQVVLPYVCSCGTRFTNLEDYKDHAYVSCLVEFYCDICFVTVKTIDAFQKHAAEMHDNSEGFVLVQEDNYKQKKVSITNTRASGKREYTDESNIITGKRRVSYKPSIIDDDEDNDSLSAKIPGTQCPICEKEYSSNNNMWRHYKTHLEEDNTQKSEYTDDSIYCCPDCGGMFTTVEWEKHKEMHKKKHCNECGKVFQFQSELDQHMSVHLNPQGIVSPNGDGTIVVVMCDVCEQMFTNKEKLEEHKLTHEKPMPVLESIENSEDSKPKKFACKLCDKTYAYHAGLWDHKRKKHPEHRSPLNVFRKKCKFCDKILHAAGSYLKHIQMHERNRAKELEQAQPEPGKREAVPKPKANSEDPVSYHTCKRCFKVFGSRYNLKNHMKSHGIKKSPTGKSIKKFGKKVWCNICHCAFANIAHLERHRTEDHSDVDDAMPVLSDEQSEDLKLPFVYTCDVCVQTFNTKIGLKKHKESHAKEVRPTMKNKQPQVCCKFCKISFANPNQLSNHMKYKHNNMQESTSKPKQYNCKICNKSFNSFSAMSTHQGWHKRIGMNVVKTEITVKAKVTSVIKEETIGNDFQCSRCDAVCPNDTALQIHILEKHRNINATVVPVRCSMCNLDFNFQEDYEEHKRFHVMVEKQPKKTHPCVHCTATFTKAEALKTHVVQFHREQQQSEFHCHLCDRVFEKASSLSIHLKVHEKQKMSTGGVVAAPKKFSCSICNKGFDLPKDLRLHTIQTHPF